MLTWNYLEAARRARAKRARLGKRQYAPHIDKMGGKFSRNPKKMGAPGANRPPG